MVDKDLFLHDLSVVAILKDEGPYLKEWLDYHLLAGVDHFYLYDNDSSDNQAEVARPYVEAGLVDYFPAPGKNMQMLVYNDAVKRFKFFSRYMAFIDLDEFIFPRNKSEGGISEVVDEILSADSEAGGLAFHFQIFGSNGHEKADYSRGVLERFTRRAPRIDEINQFRKNIADPRKIDYFQTMHFINLLAPFHLVNEDLKPLLPSGSSLPVSAKKIVVNHYHVKSTEEYTNTKMRRGWPCSSDNPYTLEEFHRHDRNEVFDDGILKYRATRAENFSLEGDGQRFDRVTEALVENLSGAEISLEAALTCRALSSYFRERFPNDAEYWKICEEKSLDAILKSSVKISDAEARLLIRDLPNLLRLPYPATEKIYRRVLNIIGQMMDFSRQNIQWKNFVALDYLRDILKFIGG
ncbi:MAG: glycosyltransferase family 92 protein [Selenomonadaceae bacterium]|nr:glycosyltransferase family 92 protein [Selenomonadaceae bacterium]